VGVIEGIVVIELLGFDAVTGSGKESAANVHFGSGSDGENADAEGKCETQKLVDGGRS